ncbi:MAG: alpha/beta hydrolase [Salibacteraceae bacterium]|nr:alpha/beta hydrolase [Salibacteraceae bacterium]
MIQHLSFILKSIDNRPMAVDVTFNAALPIHKLALYAHGISGFKDWGGMDLIARAFAEKGIAFVKFNFSKNGTTPDHLTDFVDLEAYGKDNYCQRQHDLDSMMDWIESETFPLKYSDVTLIGHSRGGVDMLLFAANHKRGNRLITWAAPSNTKTPWSKWTEEQLEEWKREGVRYVKNGRTGQEMPIYYQLKRENELFGHEMNIAECASKVTVPWLIIHGSEDEAVPFSQAEDLKQYQPNAQLVTIEKTGHTFGRKFPWTAPNLPEASEKLCEVSIGHINSN